MNLVIPRLIKYNLLVTMIEKPLYFIAEIKVNDSYSDVKDALILACRDVMKMYQGVTGYYSSHEKSILVVFTHYIVSEDYIISKIKSYATERVNYYLDLGILSRIYSFFVSRKVEINMTIIQTRENLYATIWNHYRNNHIRNRESDSPDTYGSFIKMKTTGNEGEYEFWNITIPGWVLIPLEDRIKFVFEWAISDFKKYTPESTKFSDLLPSSSRII